MTASSERFSWTAGLWRVRVWFGEQVIATYVGDAAHAERYEHAMRRRFVGLRTTNEPVGVHAQLHHNGGAHG